MFVPTIIVGIVVPAMTVGTDVPTIVVQMAYYWKSGGEKATILMFLSVF